MATIVQSIDEINKANQPLKVADAVNADEALSKGQLLTEIKAIDGIGSGLDADSVQGVTKDLLGIGGDGYALVDETANREAGTTYTNTYGKPIEVSVNIGTDGSTGTLRVMLLVDGEKVSCGSDSDTSYSPKASARAIIPNGSTYSVDSGTISGTISGWFELK